MTPEDINESVVAHRAAWVLNMLSALKELPIEDKDAFLQDKHHVAAAESYLRRALEALFDIGRHILAKKFAYPATEYKEIAKGLLEKKILDEESVDLMRKMAGYRNRMVHFYHEVTPDELHEICLNHLGEVQQLLDALLGWARRRKAEAS